MPELSGPITSINKHMQIVTGPVLVPDEPDSDGDVLSKEKIESLSFEYMEKYRNNDLQHTLNNVASVVESYILPYPMTIKAYGNTVELPKGTWMMSVKVGDSEVWQAVLDGRLTGFSIMGVKRQVMEDFSLKSATEEEVLALKSKSQRTTLKDLGEDFVVTHVSLVDEPAVPKAKFFSIKSKEHEEKGMFKRFMEFMKQEQARKEAEEDMTKEEVLAIVKEALKEKEEAEEQEDVTDDTDNQDDKQEDKEESKKEKQEESKKESKEDKQEKKEDKKTEAELTIDFIKNLISEEVSKLAKTEQKDTKTESKKSKSSRLDPDAEQVKQPVRKSKWDHNGQYIG